MKYKPSLDFWLPSNKEGYINYLYNRYPNVSLNKWVKMKSKKLKAIYIAIRSKKG